MEYCPHCSKVRSMRVTTKRRLERSKDRSAKQIESRTYHCQTCNAFVRSEDVELADAKV